MRVAALALIVGVACTAPEPTVPTAPGANTDLTWQELPPAPTPRTEVAAAGLGERVYVMGGFIDPGETVATVEIYDVEQRSWAKGPDLPVPVNHPMAAASREEIFLLGGYRGPGLTDPSPLGFALRGVSWKQLPPMPEPRAAGGAAVLDGRLYVVGGIGPAGLATGTMALDLEAMTWSMEPGLPTEREHLGVASDGRILYAVGGRAGGVGNMAEVEAFDPGTGVWRALAPMPTARGGLAATATAAGLLVAAGGEADETFKEVEALDPETGEWISLPPLPTPRHGLGVVALGDVVYVVSGGPTPGFSFSAANEALDLSELDG